METNIGAEAEKVFEIKDIGVFLKNVLNVAVVAGALIALAILVWGALDWLMSEGDQDKLKNAKNKITHALIGLAVMALVWLVWNLALYFLGIGQVGEGETILTLPE